MLRFCAPILLGLVLLLVGCSALSPYSTQTRLELELTASDHLNPDINGRPSPIVLRLLELKSPVLFETVDFFGLYSQSKELLAPDLVASEELELRPGERLQLKLHVKEGSRYVGVLAAYRDLPETKWRHVIRVTPDDMTRAELSLDHRGIRDGSEALARVDGQ
ncbi:type VI secretion system lipoprotein TssJ [Pseudomonas sp. DSP3-2-2]|uniref:type VI secretion system lipoprotein TssJ n=1 Tax=unclassified Pseudomonas TaxID=196821 RepID=UPI003CF271D1